MQQLAPQVDQRPGLAIVTNCLPPYRVHLHELIAAGIPELKLHSLVTHDDGDFRWKLQMPESLHVTHFGRPGDSPTASMLWSPWREWSKGERIIQYLREHQVRAVICTSYRYISYLRVISTCHRDGIPLFANIDSNIRSDRDMPKWKELLKRRVYRWWLDRVTGVMPMGVLGGEYFTNYGADPERFYRVPCTPDYRAFADCDPDRLRRFRERHGLYEGRRIILFSGRLAQVKRVDLLIQAFQKIAAERPHWDLLIAGDGPLAPRLRKLAGPLGARVKWTGFLEQDELKLAYHASDVLALPSEHEPWAVVVQEAMAAGLAIVASDVVGAAVDLVADGVAGRIFPVGSVEGLRQALLEVTDNKRIDDYRTHSREALEEWRRRVDPVSEVRRALMEADVLTTQPQPAIGT
jgi:glycosyltransferase involved in cell wall biosynthesis